MGEGGVARRRGVGRRLAVRVAVWCAVLLVGGVIVRVGGCAESLAYWPTRGETVPHLAVEDVWFEAGDGTRLHGWWLAPRGVAADGRHPAVLHVHGNAGKIGDHVDNAAFLRESGIGVFVFDYAGYGMSGTRGAIRRDGVLADTRAALAYVKGRSDVDPSRIGVYGFSLGGCFALAVAAEDEGVASVATLSTFSSWKGAAGDYVPVVGPWLISSGLDQVDSVDQLGDRPYLVVHGTADGIVDFRHSEVLRERAVGAGVAVEYVAFEGADHNHILVTHPAARETIAGFFERTLGVVDRSWVEGASADE